MASSKALWCIVCAFLVNFTQAKVTVSDLSGVWRGYSPATTSAVLTPQGPAFVCVDTLPVECAEQLPPVEETYTFNGTTLSYETRDKIEILTEEQSAALTPACAKHGIFPIQSTSSVPPSKIKSYDYEAERLFYIDPRRPKVINCVPLRYRVKGEKPYLEIEHTSVFQGSPMDALTLGSTFICEAIPETCFLEINETEMNAGFYTAFNLSCIDGDCLDAGKAAAPSSLNGPAESPNDV